MSADTFDEFPTTFEAARSRACYRAYCTRIVDGDTYDFILDLGCTARIKIRGRLKDLDTAEYFHPENDAEYQHSLAAIALVTDLIFDRPCLVRTYRTRTDTDVITVGRYVTTVYYRNEIGEWHEVRVALDEAGMRKRASYV